MIPTDVVPEVETGIPHRLPNLARCSKMKDPFRTFFSEDAVEAAPVEDGCNVQGRLRRNSRPVPSTQIIDDG